MESAAPPIAKPPRTLWRGRPLLIVLPIAAIALGVFVTGSIRHSTGPATGEGQSGALPMLPAGKTVFRVATFNMHSGVGGDDNIYNIGRTADAVRDTDLCALQEVRGYLTGPVANQAQLLAEQTDHAWLYSPTERTFWHDEFGNGLLTKLRVENWVRLPLPTEPAHAGLRNATIARIDFGGQIVPVLFCHIDREADQTNQLEMVFRIFESMQSPCLLLADLNSESKNAQVQAVLAFPGVHDCVGESNGDAGTHDRIDWILARGFKTIGGGHLQNGASDHPIYWADVKIDK